MFSKSIWTTIGFGYVRRLTLVIDTQDEQPRHRIQLKKVGVKNLKTFIITEKGGFRHHIIPTVEMTIDLPAKFKGIHMSRLVESMTEVISDEFSVQHSIEDIQIHILEALQKKHAFQRGEIKFDFEFGYTSKTPVSNKRTWEVCDISATTIMENSCSNVHDVSVKVTGNTVCPHCLANNGGLTHMQRAIGILRVVGSTDQIPSYGSMIEVIENSFSSKTYSLLKLEDEVHVTKQMHENPLFVEDVCRNVLQHANDAYEDRQLEMYAGVRSLESIHKHDVIAEGRIVTNGM
ncbi:MAG: GTP cyclohydrolase I FolE2 [Candidatus Thorarchaeota archaeon]|nr:GTP cyclohydrolase I FolE2 [Candidatus Thorarchaeota archaeon]